MTHRERVIAALEHEEPDRVPMDLGGSLASTIVNPAYGKLLAEMGFPGRESRETLRYASLAQVDENVRQALDVDIAHAPRAFGTGAQARILSEDRFVDEWGVQWHKPEQGHYYVERAPFEEASTPAAIERYAWPEPADIVRLDGLADAIDQLRSRTDYAISLELAGRVMSMGQFLCNFENWMADLALYPSFVEALLERTTQIQIEINDILLRAVGDRVDIVYTADDLGGQNCPLISPEFFRRLFKPYFRRIWGHIREKTDARLMHHCCGSIYPFIGDFVELGVQALNPIQVSAGNMDPARMKSEFGKHLCFWGGVDTGEVMPRGSAADVREEVSLRIRQMGVGGGYILAAVHNIQPEVPPANVLELFRAGGELGRYPLSAVGAA